jgi:hypothetical protein
MRRGHRIKHVLTRLWLVLRLKWSQNPRDNGDRVIRKAVCCTLSSRIGIFHCGVWRKRKVTIRRLRIDHPAPDQSRSCFRPYNSDMSCEASSSEENSREPFCLDNGIVKYCHGTNRSQKRGWGQVSPKYSSLTMMF